MQTTVRPASPGATPPAPPGRAPSPSGSRPHSLAARTISGLMERAVQRSGISCAVKLASGEYLRFGPRAPQFTVVFHDDKPLLGPLTELALGEAYMRGDFDLEGDMYAMQEVRSLLRPQGNLAVGLGFLWQLFAMPATWVNRHAIEQHYNHGDDFYLAVVDERYRFYSHCLFKRDDESLEEAAEHKLESMWNGLQLKAGMRLLDIGGGWGPVHQYCGPRGVAVTSLTIARDSYDFITALDRRLGLAHCRVKLEDFLVHAPGEPYDAIVIFGVIEHIPNYRRFCAQVWKCLRPGGRLYLDASASIEKYAASDFIRRHVWPGAHSFLCLQDIVQELLFHGMDVVETKNETHDYEVTMRRWAERLDAKRDFIIERWGARLYRLWRLYLWTGAYGFHVDALQAYHVVAQKRADPGPRPGPFRRAMHFVRSFK